MYGLSPMEAILESAANGLGLIGADEDEENESQGDEDSNEEESNDESQGEESEDDEEEDDKTKGLREAKDRAIAEKRKARADLAAARAEIARLTAEQNGDRPEAERLAEAEATITSQEATIRDLRLQNAFLSSNKHDWQDPSLALSLADMESVEIGDDGEVVGLEDALSALAKKHPYLVKKPEEQQRKKSGDQQQRKNDAAAKASRRSKIRGKYNI